MSVNKNEITCNNGDSVNPPEFVMTEYSQSLLCSIEKLLDDLLNRTDLIPSSDEFYCKFREILDIYDRLQLEVLKASGINVVCGAGCSNCCCHWVDDVSSVEAVIISRYLKEQYPDMIESVIRIFQDDAEVLNSLHAIVDEKSDEYSSFEEEIEDSYDLLLTCFYQLERPCALLDDKGQCIIYPVRPFTCRDFLNIKDPEACHPERINEEGNATLIMYLSDTISQKLEQLHLRFDDGSADMSLRSLLVRYLK